MWDRRKDEEYGQNLHKKTLIYSGDLLKTGVNAGHLFSFVSQSIRNMAHNVGNRVPQGQKCEDTLLIGRVMA